MYRREIDHPQYVPEESRGLLDFESGKEFGRIYRVVRTGARPNSDLGRTPAREQGIAQIVAGLESAEEWSRQRAFRLLLERGDRAAVPRLEKLATGAPRPETRGRALWALRRLEALSPQVLAVALRDSAAGVREQAVLLAEDLLPQEGSLLPAVLTTAEDEDARVRFTAALVLGSVPDSQVVAALASIATRDGGDRWTRAAVMSGVGSRMGEFLGAFRERRSENPRAFPLVMEHLGRMMGAGAPTEACRDFLTETLAAGGELSWRIAAVLGLAEGLRSRGGAKAREQNPLAALLDESAGVSPSPASEMRAGRPRSHEAALQSFYRAARDLATSDQAPTPERVSAVSLLGYTDMEFAGAALGRLLDARQPPEVQLQAVRAIDRLGDARGGGLLTSKENWSRYTPRVREAVVAAITSKPPLIGALFAAIEGGVIAPAEISSVRRTQLLKHSDAKIRTAAEAIFKDLEGGDRMQVYRNYRESLNSGIDLVRGREAFLRACSACHTYNGEGGNVGPDLTGNRYQPADAILLHTIVPNYEVAPSYQTLSIVTQDGRSFSGWLSAESEGSLTLRTAAGTEEIVLRRTIASLTTTSVSLMPDGLEQLMTKEEMASLIAYLKSEP
jgi:putative heme-binding domain-containing protein